MHDISTSHSTVGTESPLARLKRERDRFVLFAFAGADILIELDANGNVRFAAGALSPLGRSAVELNGTPFEQLVVPQHRDQTNRLLAEIGQGERRNTYLLNMLAADDNEARIRVSGYRLPDMDNHYFLSLTMVDASAPGAGTQAQKSEGGKTMPADSFTALAIEKLATAGKAKDELDLTLIELGELGSLRARIGVEELHAFTEEIVGRLRTQSVGGDAVTAFGPDKLGLIHGKDAEIHRISDGIVERARALDPDDRGISVRHSTLDLEPGELSEGDAVRALVYTMSQFSRSDSALDFESLRESYDTMLNDTVGRIEAFRHLVHDGDFRVAFQPIVRLRNRKVHHFEALVRFGSSKVSTSPFELIKFAEDAGLVAEFDHAMCKRIIDMLNSVDGEIPRVAVNLSARSLTNDDFLRRLRTLLAGYPSLSNSLLLEVTESFNISNLPAMGHALRALREDGYKVCLDDFGVGATNLNYLRQLPVDFVKIDGSYVRGLLTTPHAKAFLKSIVTLCRKLHVQTIAEFIEDDQTAQFLQANGVQLGQGHLFGKPEFGLPHIVPA